MKKRFFIIPLAIVLGVVFFVEALFILLPTRVVEEALKKGVRQQYGLAMNADSFEKVFPLGYEAKGVRLISAQGGKGLYLTRVRGRFSPLSLLGLRPGLILSGDIYGGVMKGRVGRGMGAAYARINLKGAVLPPIETFGGIEPGVADIQIDITIQGAKTCPEGIIKAKARQGRIRGFSIIGIGIPKGEISEEGLDVRLSKCKAYVKSAWIKGPDFSAKARGVINMASALPHAPMDMRIEVSPKGRLMEDLDRLTILRPYRRSPGYYRAVIRGTPSAPVITAE